MNREELKQLFQETSQGLQFQCWIQPRASRNAVVGIHNDCLKISLTAPPVEGKANTELCRFFSKKLSVAKSRIQLVSGHASRKKRLLIVDLSAADFLEKIGA